MQQSIVNVVSAVSARRPGLEHWFVTHIRNEMLDMPIF